MERFENVIFKQREEINDRMTKMFGLLKELITSRAPKKRIEEGNDKDDIETNGGINETDTETSVKEAEIKNEAENRTENKPIKKAEKEEAVEAPSSQPVGYYLKHSINEKLIDGLVDNNRFNDSLLGVRLGKIKGKTYNLSPRGPVYEAILKKKITKKRTLEETFKYLAT
ncbi:hypothetical protein Tco_1414843 [Tanacetum coccineum]